MTKLLSVVVSVYNEELALREFYAETGKILKRLPGNWDYEFLFVNDGSRDQSDPKGVRGVGRKSEDRQFFQELRA